MALTEGDYAFLLNGTDNRLTGIRADALGNGLASEGSDLFEYGALGWAVDNRAVGAKFGPLSDGVGSEGSDLLEYGFVVPSPDNRLVGLKAGATCCFYESGVCKENYRVVGGIAKRTFGAFTTNYTLPRNITLGASTFVCTSETGYWRNFLVPTGPGIPLPISVFCVPAGNHGFSSNTWVMLFGLCDLDQVEAQVTVTKLAIKKSGNSPLGDYSDQLWTFPGGTQDHLIGVSVIEAP